MGLQALLEKALEKWNSTLGEITDLLVTPIDSYNGGVVYSVARNISDGLQAIAVALLIICFFVGIIQTASSISDTKRPEYAVKAFIRLIVTKEVVTRGLDLMLMLVNLAQGVVSQIATAGGGDLTEAEVTLDEDIVTAISELPMIQSILCWLVTLIGYLVIVVISFIILLTVYGRFFKLYIYTAISPIPLATFSGLPTSQVGKGFVRSYIAVCMEAVIIMLACIVFTAYTQATGGVSVDTSGEANVIVMEYITNIIFNMLILVGIIKASDRIVREMMGV